MKNKIKPVSISYEIWKYKLGYQTEPQIIGCCATKKLAELIIEQESEACRKNKRDKNIYSFFLKKVPQYA